MGKLKLLLAMALLLTVGQVSAQSADGLYSAKVEIADRSFATRNRVMNQAMAQVLAKITGSYLYRDNPAIEAALADPDRFLQAYSYSTLPPDTTFLHARFGASSINRLLREANIPIWPANRPQALVWLVFKDYQLGTQLPLPDQKLDDGQRLPVWQQLQEAANSVGLPIIVPTIDPSDSSLNASAERIWSLGEQELAQLSQGYRTDSVIVGRIAHTSSGSWSISWSYRQGELIQVFDSGDLEFDLALQDGLAQITRYLSSIYSVSSNSSAQGEALAVTITNINSFADYARVISYLDSLAMVNHYELQTVDASQLAVTLFLNGSYSNLTTALALDKRLQPNPIIPGQTVAMRWMGN